MSDDFEEADGSKSWKHVPSAIPSNPITLQLRHEGQREEQLESSSEVDPQVAVDGLSSTDWIQRVQRFEEILQLPTIEIGTENLCKKSHLKVEMLRKLSWKGIPPRYRALVWKILIGYLPNITNRHASTLERRRIEYQEIVKQHFGRTSRRDETIMHQIAIDVPRTAPESALFKNQFIRESLARILYCWSIRRPASGYVQGINDLITPFYEVFVEDLIQVDGFSGSNVGSTPTSITISEESLRNIEADSFWCLSLLLDEIQDNYTFSQSGISRQLQRMRDIVQRTEPKLLAHLDEENVTFLQFAFRWVNCLLIREFPLYMIIRMWDTYLAEGESGFSIFHIFVCAAFLSKWSDRLQLLDFQDILLFIQNPPTANWSLLDLEVLLSEAFMWKTVFEDSIDHLKSPK